MSSEMNKQKQKALNPSNQQRLNQSYDGKNQQIPSLNQDTSYDYYGNNVQQ